MTLSACGGGGGGAGGADLAFNGLPYHDPDAVEIGPVALRPGETVTTELRTVSPGLTDRLGTQQIQITRIDNTHLRLDIGGTVSILEQDPSDPDVYSDPDAPGTQLHRLYGENLNWDVMALISPGAVGSYGYGRLTAPEDMPTSGTGLYLGSVHAQRLSDADAYTFETWAIALTADFDGNQITAVLDAGGTPVGMQATTFGPDGFASTLTGAGGISGTIDGAFHGGPVKGGIVGGLTLTEPGAVYVGTYATLRD